MNQAILSSPPDQRPLHVRKILGRAFSIYRRDFITLVGIVALINIPLLVMQASVDLLLLPGNLTLLLPGPYSSSPLLQPLISEHGATLLLALPNWIAGALQIGAVAVAVSKRYRGREPSIEGAYRDSLPHWRGMLPAAIVVGAVNLVVWILIVFLAMGGRSATNSSADGASSDLLATGLCAGMIPLVAFLAFINIKWLFAMPAIVLENLGPWQGLGRSWRLVKGSFWRVVWVQIGLYLFTMIIAIPAFLIGILVGSLRDMSPIAETMINGVSETIFIPFVLAGQTLLYFELRKHKEGHTRTPKAQSLLPHPPAAVAG